MRLLGRVAFALLLTGCTSLTEVDVGAGQLPVITISGVMATPAAEAQAGHDVGTWVTAAGERFTLTRDGDRMQLSASEDIEFFSAEQSRVFREKLGGHARAVTRIDVDLQQIALVGAAADGPQPFQGDAVLDGTVLGGNGITARVSLSKDTRDRVIADVEDGAAVELGFGLEVDCLATQLATVPGRVQVQLVLQPILVVQALEAL